jgi:hypothetical protein
MSASLRSGKWLFIIGLHSPWRQSAVGLRFEL